ncbi:hypothetical protein [Ensifer sp.]|uniref:hypothetical protein n=1 Tax=Ensifer sp. TaxID=1872086 RepID=UPI000DDC0052|nr:hypothetical protein [Ensifer sp.]
MIEEDERVKMAATTVPKLLGHPAMTLDQASRLHVNIAACVERLDALIAALELNGVDRAWVQMATTIRNHWAALAEDAARKVLLVSGDTLKTALRS